MLAIIEGKVIESGYSSINFLFEENILDQIFLIGPITLSKKEKKVISKDDKYVMDAMFL